MSVQTPRDKVFAFLRSAVFNSARGACQKISLRQLINGSISIQGLRDWDIPEMREGEVTGDHGNLEDLADEISILCQQDADGSSMPSQYCVVSFHNYETSWSLRSPRLTFRGDSSEVIGGDGGYGGGYESEPATSAGHMAQMMRQNEGLHRTTIGALGQIIDMQGRQIARMIESHERTEQMRLQAMMEHEEALSMKHEREIEMGRAKQQEEMRQEMFNHAKILLPTIVNAVAGRRMLPEKTDTEVEIIFQLMGTIKPEQAKAIFAALDPQQVIDFQELYQLLATKGVKAPLVEVKELMGKIFGSVDRQKLNFICGILSNEQAAGLRQLYKTYGPKDEPAAAEQPN